MRNEKTSRHAFNIVHHMKKLQSVWMSMMFPYLVEAGSYFRHRLTEQA
jgi:hypothetical protein